MAIQKKYVNPLDSSEYLIVIWEKGFNQVEVLLNDKEVYFAQSLNDLRANNSFVLTEGSRSNIQLKVSYNPASIEVFFNGFQSENNSKHPKKELKNIGYIFWLLAISVIIVAGIEYFYLQNVPELLVITLGFDLLALIAYVTAGILINKGKSLGFWIGYIMFCLRTLIWLLLKFIVPDGILIGGLFRATAIAHLSRNITVVNDLKRHEKLINKSNSDDRILDSNF
ncbi:MAG: hypothetical protein ACK479_14720 [Fluviicola sp.]